MTKSKKLLLLTAVLALVIGAAYLTGKLSAQKEPAAEDTDIIVCQIEADDVTALSWTYNGETLDFAKTDEGWRYAADPDFPLKESFLTKMTDKLEKVTASKSIEQAEDLSQYSLDVPTLTVSVYAGEDVTTLSFGGQTEMTQEYYFTAGDGNVYLTGTALYNCFAYDLYDLVQKETIPSMSNINKVMVTAADDTKAVTDAEALTSFADALSGIAFGDCVAYQADASALENYGLHQPDTVFTIHYTKIVESATEETDEEGNMIYETTETAESFTLEMSESEDGTCYARLPGSSMVYTMASTVYEAVHTLLSP